MVVQSRDKNKTLIRLKNTVIVPLHLYVFMLPPFHAFHILDTITLTYYFFENIIDQTGQLTFENNDKTNQNNQDQNNFYGPDSIIFFIKPHQEFLHMHHLLSRIFSE